jgi:diguanylate cyclase (GGDEF)-like protein
MLKNISKSLKKFKEDVVSKMIYDILKWLIRLIVIFAFSKFIPKGTTFQSAISTQISLTVYQIVLFVFAIITVTTISIYAVFNLKYNKLKSDYHTDKLTGLKNHIALEQYLQKQIQIAKKDGSLLSLVLIDIDNFKQVNEKIGYNLADDLLRKVGEVLGNDKRATDETFRYFQRGDEFLIVLNETSLDGAMKAANRKKQLLSKVKFETNGSMQQLTVCCGVTEFNRTNDDYASLTERVNKALLDAKKVLGKNCVNSII